MSDWWKYLLPGGMIKGIADYSNWMMDTPNPADKANPYIEKAREQYLPWQERGNEDYGKANPIYSQMAQNPSEFLHQLQSGYSQSPGYKLMEEDALRAASSTAAAGGRRGTPQDMQEQARIAAVLENAGLQDYTKNALGIQGTGLGGLENSINRGYGATSDIANTYNQQGGLAFQGQSQQNQQMMDLIKSLMSMMSKLGGSAASGGL